MPNAEIYRVETVEASKAPRGITQGEWCRYVISSEQSRIVGRYCGTLSKARRNAETLARSLNERRRSGKSPWTPRGRPRKGNEKAESQAATT